MISLLKDIEKELVIEDEENEEELEE